MENNIYNKRVSYTDSEISKLIKLKMDKENITKQELLDKYSKVYSDLNIDTIDDMLIGNIIYDELMLDVASDYLNIPFDELVGVIEDDNEFSCRTNSDEDISEFYDMVNILFGEMVNQIKLSGKSL